MRRHDNDVLKTRGGRVFGGDGPCARRGRGCGKPVVTQSVAHRARLSATELCANAWLFLAIAVISYGQRPLCDAILPH